MMLSEEMGRLPDDQARQLRQALKRGGATPDLVAALMAINKHALGNEQANRLLLAEIERLREALWSIEEMYDHEASSGELASRLLEARGIARHALGSTRK